ncbi:GTP-binding protein [Ereboglobus sp. PH5-5]|uniref:ribosome biogenesis GTPase Der n=1 Tax=Ereboglobus sp. PH5-5 TaxID=2940529 RepID=UPI002405AB5E|nr:ribosome biogenesis GTPase Der [Ereboglobus sp. PH5-5]MDF9833020.1 GTP-binding protein [Ereboglobus sp. PH5-5]
MSRSVVIVGRPNVGKSRLFNRLARKRISIVHDKPGITRDVVTTRIADGDYTLQDTGGLGLKGGETPAQLIAASEKQVSFAIDTATLILFVVDGLEGLTALDTRIAAELRKGKKPVLLVVNKADFGEEKIDVAEAYRLGLGEPLFISAEHGRGETDLRTAIKKHLDASDTGEAVETQDGAPKPLCVCFIGRPNVGKSSLSNRLLRSDRLIVSDVPGTTRDAVTHDFQFRGRDKKLHPFRLIDTAGIKAATKLASPVEYFSRLRSLDSIKETDVVFVVLDAMEGVTQQDKAIAGEAIKEHKPIIVVVNKWDLVHKAFADGTTAGTALRGFKDEREYREKYEKAVFERLYFTPGAPLIFVSAMSGYEVSRMLNSAVKLHRVLDKKIPTARLNKLIVHLAERTPPPAVAGRRFRIYYATQTSNHPFRIKIFCNREGNLAENYRRYLEAGVINEFDLHGCPVYFDLVGKKIDPERVGKYSDEKRAHLARLRKNSPAGETPGGDDDDFQPFETIED